jgi:(p)ppGpp synthase/HD superfamily hydrolase
MDKTLDSVRNFASKAHQGQMRKYIPVPYIVHPVRVSEIVEPYNPRLPIVAAALLHDVVEDTIVSETALSVFLHNVMEPEEASETLRLVMELTDVYVKSSFPQWNRRKRKEKELERIATTSPDAQTIKYADILDNTGEIASYDPAFAPRYLGECLAILQKADKGNPDLYARAFEGVTTAMDSLSRKSI